MLDKLGKIYLLPGNVAVAAHRSEITTILGSCVAVAIHDPEAKIGGLCHYLLPVPSTGERETSRYGSIALPTLIQMLLAQGAELRTLQAKLYGGANVLNDVAIGKCVGEENVAIALRLLEQARIPILYQNTGGTQGRRIVFRSDTFEIIHSLMKKPESLIPVGGKSCGKAKPRS